MKHHVYTIADGAVATIAPAAEMIRCHWCSIAISPQTARRPPDDIVTYQGQAICVRCGRQAGVVVRQVREA